MQKDSMKKKGLTYLIFTIVVLLLIIIFRPVPQIEEEDALVYEGFVVDIYETGEKDVAFKLEDGALFYINRGLESGLNIDSLKTSYLGKELLFKYPDYWTPLDPSGSHKHASQVEFGDTLIYSEF